MSLYLRGGIDKAHIPVVRKNVFLSACCRGQEAIMDAFWETELKNIFYAFFISKIVW